MAVRTEYFMACDACGNPDRETASYRADVAKDEGKRRGWVRRVIRKNGKDVPGDVCPRCQERSNSLEALGGNGG